uniref:Uncharacterized protein n=1 Tax=Labrus bergylta TaxID=56723 RepID=A0A3Q3FF07_9LABR
VMQASSPVDSNVGLLFVQLDGTGCSTGRWGLAELKQAIKHWTVLSHINCKAREFDVIVTVILSHLLTADLHLSVQAIVKQQVVSHADSVGPSALSWLFLVLPLCGSEEIVQNTPQVLKGGPVFWTFPPAQTHDVVKPLRTIFWLWHSVAPLQVLDYLWVGHT